jgi:predicted phage terminase large subunit-like protein
MNQLTTNVPAQLTQEDWLQIKNNRNIRMDLAKQDLYWFFHLYFGHYIEFQTADFQRDIFRAVASEDIEHLVVVAFRGSGKSTIVSMAYPLWAMVGSMQKKYIVIVSQTQQQAQQHLRNFRAEVESNELFRNDFGNLEEESNEWGISALTMPQLGAKIIAVSREQGVRGLRSGPHRPDLVISDDVEDTNSVKTREGRNKTYDWFTSEIMPIGSLKTKFVTIGNLLHEDSLLMRLKDGFVAGSHTGTYLEYPIDMGGKSMWPGMYPNMEAIERQRRRIGNRLAWEREYRLHIVPSDEQIILPSMIHRYSSIPEVLRGEYQQYAIGVDLAISENTTADCTAMVKLDRRGFGRKTKIYVLAQPVNQRMNFNRTIDTIHQLNEKFSSPTFYVESVAYQESAVQSLKADGVNAVGVKPRADKRTRLNMIADKIERGIVVFPETGCEELIAQLVGFGVEKHDDLVDALTMAVIELMNEERRGGSMWIGTNPIWSQHGIGGTHRNGGREYWNRRLDDFNEATSGKWD